MDEETLLKISKLVARGEWEGRVGDLAFTVHSAAMGNFLPAIASYIRTGKTSGSLLGVAWSLETRPADKAPLTLRERAIEIVRSNAIEDGVILDEIEFNYAVEQVRGALERQPVTEG